MTLKLIVDSLDNVPDNAKELYVEKDGKYILPVEGAKSEDDFQKVQKALLNERESTKQLKQKYSYFDDKDISEIQQKLDKYQELELLASAKIEELAKSKTDSEQLLEARVKSRLTPLEREKEELLKKASDLEALVISYKAKESKRILQDNIIKVTSAAQGFKNEALEDVLLHADLVFEINEEGNPVTKDVGGLIPGMSPEMWFSEISARKRIWFGESVGAGSNPSTKVGNFSMDNNPFSEKSWNLTKQIEMKRLHPEEAKRFEAAAKKGK